MAAIQTIINEAFIDRLSALQQGDSREGAAVAKAISNSGSSESRISKSIRFGAQFYAKALSGINFGASFLNFARADLQQLGTITQKMIDVVSQAASPSSSRNDRLQAEREVRTLGRDFKEIIQGAKVGDREYLSGNGIEEVLSALGLSPNDSRTVKEVFQEFVSFGTENSLADLGIKGEDSSVPREAGRAHPAHDSEDLFSGGRVISKRADAIAVLDDLHALQGQIQRNISVVDELTGVLAENARLVRTTALAFLEIGNSIDSETKASEVAKGVQKLILKNAREALSHADNLEPIILATLNFDKEGIVTDEF